MINTCYLTRELKLLIKTIALVIVLTVTVRVEASNITNVEGEDVVIETSFVLGKGVCCAVTGGVNINTDDFINEGVWVFVNAYEIEINLPSYNLGGGGFVFNGEANQYIHVEGGECQFGYMKLNMPSSIYLNGSIGLHDSLILSNGLFHIEGENKLSLKFESPSNLKMADEKSDQSYIVGNLTRTTKSATSYFFPVGDETGYHPLYLSDIDSNDELNVFFERDIPFNWQGSGVNRDLELIDIGGWIVKSDLFIDNSFIIGLSSFDDSGNFIENANGIFYSEDPVFFSESVEVSSTLVSSRDLFVENTTKYYQGAYALISNTDEFNEVPNIIVANDANETYLKFNLGKYKNIKLRIYDSFGRIVYRSNAYSNDFDTKKYTSGTYYYYIDTELKNGKKILKTDILEIVRPK